MTFSGIKLSGIIFILVLFFSFIYSCSISSETTKRLLNESFTKKYDLIIVPGVPFENGKWSPVMKARIYWSKYLFEKGIAKNIMYSGGAVYSPYLEGQIMALYAEAIGIPKKNIFVETRAEHSTENVYYSYRKATLKHGFKIIALASDPYQSWWLKRFTKRKVSRDIRLIPIVFDTLINMEKIMVNPQIDYQQAFVKDFVSIRERDNLRKRYRGMKGRYIDENAYRD